MPWSATLLGLVAGAVCCPGGRPEVPARLDDSLDVVGVHFVGGWVGCLWIGFFATYQSGFPNTLMPHEGLVYGGGTHQLISQAEGAGVVTVWSFVVALVIGFIVKSVGLFRLKPHLEVEGIDVRAQRDRVRPPRAVAVLASGRRRRGASAETIAAARKCRRSVPPDGRFSMKLVTAVIKPHQLDAVKRLCTPWVSRV